MKTRVRFHAIAVAALITQLGRAQGTLTYLSNLSEPSAGDLPVGSDSWVAAGIDTGNNPGGYMLDSVQIELTDASGNPGGFSVMLYSSVEGGATLPGVSLGALSGPADPVTAGTYTYMAPANLTLLPNADYFLVLTATTPITTGAYGWSYANDLSNQSLDNWIATVALTSSDGSMWIRPGSGPNYNSPIFSLDATPAPEPGVLSLFGMGALFLVWNRRKWDTVV